MFYGNIDSKGSINKVGSKEVNEAAIGNGKTLRYDEATGKLIYDSVAGPTGPTGAIGPTGPTGATGASGVVTRGTFVNGDLVAGILTISHNLSLSSPYGLIVVIFDNTSKMIVPDDLTGAANSIAVDLTSYGTLSGTWQYIYVN